jgi:hypothetical protein
MASSTSTQATRKPATTAKAGKVATVVAKATGRAPKVASKVCRVCGINKPLTDYRVKASRPDGRDSICTEDARLWLANRKAQIAAAAKPVAKAKPATKRVAKPVAKPVAKVATKPVPLTAREAAARARDAKAKVASA